MIGRICKKILLVVLLIGLPIGSLLAQPDRQQDIKFSVWLAKEPRITKINIEGNNFYSDSEIRKRLFSRESSFWEALKTESRNRFYRYSINRDTLEIKYLYLREGFLNVKISEKAAVSVPDSSAIVTISIDENSRFLIAHVNLKANDSLVFYHDLQNIVSRFKTGDPVDPIKLNNAVFDLKTFYANNGYPYATVIHEIDTTTGPANASITLIASEGQLVRFGDMTIRNLLHVKPALVNREITFSKGELYSRKKIIESRKRLYSTGMFHTLNLDISREAAARNQSGQSDTNPDFIFSGIERKPYFVSIKTGVAQDSLQDLTWDFSTAWGKRNFLRSRRLELSIKSRYIIFTQWRPLSHRFQIRFTEPWFFGIRMPLSLTTRFEPGVRSQVQAARIQRWSVSLSTRKEWSQELSAMVTGGYENINIYGVDTLEAAAIRDTVRARRKLGVTLIRDSRLDKFVPKSGSFTTYFAEYVGGFLGGDDGFLKLEFSWARYQQAIGPAVFATRIKAGWIKESGDANSVPIEDRFFLGGANSIRGFRENSIGPRKEGINDPTIDSTNVGANAYAVFNQELRFPVYGKLWASIFTDMGNGWKSFSDAQPSNILFSYGMGIQFLSPAGPIRLDYARRLENGIYTEDDRFHITILYAF
ncbi:MAG: BamA/TamA family outer membrane protein [FCB group bacterium]|nr:BamA/TamA family outer membrane protein [FCB group bacterium]